MKTLTEQEYLNQHKKHFEAKQHDLSSKISVSLMLKQIGFFPNIVITKEGTVIISPREHKLLDYDEAIEYLKLISKVIRAKNCRPVHAVNNTINLLPVYLSCYDANKNKIDFGLCYYGTVKHKKSEIIVEVRFDVTKLCYYQIYEEFGISKTNAPKTYGFSSCSYTTPVSIDWLNKWLHLKVGQHSLIQQ